MTQMERLDIATKEIRGLNLKTMFTIIGALMAGVFFLNQQLTGINNKIDRINYQNITQHKIDSLQNHDIERRLDIIEKVVPIGKQGMITR